MPQTLTFGSYLCSLPAKESSILTNVQDRLRTERSLGLAPQMTIEISLARAQEIIGMYRGGEICEKGADAALEWSLKHPEQYTSMLDCVEHLGVRKLPRCADAVHLLPVLFERNPQWLNEYTEDAEASKKSIAAALMLSNKNCSPYQLPGVIDQFFANFEKNPILGPS